MQRWKRVGCAVQLLVPVFFFLFVLARVIIGRTLLATPGDGGSGDTVGGAIGLAVVSFFALVALLLAARGVGRGPARAPAPALVAPDPSARRTPGDGSMELGAIEGTRVRVDAWRPGDAIRITQTGEWEWRHLVLAPVVPLVVWWVAGSELGIEAALGGWVLLSMVWQALPALPRSVDANWSRDAVTIRYGKRERLVGLSRIRSVELVRFSRGGHGESDSSGKTRRKLRVVTWVEPEGLDPVPYLMVETETTSSFDEAEIQSRGLESLGQAFANAVDVPFRKVERQNLAPIT